MLNDIENFSNALKKYDHAKAFMNALSDNIDKFESKNGKIRSTTNQRFENYPVKDVEDSLPN